MMDKASAIQKIRKTAKHLEEQINWLITHYPEVSVFLPAVSEINGRGQSPRPMKIRLSLTEEL